VPARRTHGGRDETLSFPPLTPALPAWVTPFVSRWRAPLDTPARRMRLAVALARENVVRGTGGPFGAAVFDAATGRLIAPGVNLVVPARCSCAHAEIVALSLAQRRLGTHDLGAPGRPRCELVCSTEPCAMCLGAIPWSGVRSVVCGARGADAEAIGMDEGDKPPRWPAALTRRGIAVRRDVLRREARAVLRLYAARGGAVYNGRGGS
jgi:tRNA(Arg) A34 adenosine deaminase TadA